MPAVNCNWQLPPGAILRQFVASCVTSAQSGGNVALITVAVVVDEVFVIVRKPEPDVSSVNGEPDTVIVALDGAGVTVIDKVLASPGWEHRKGSGLLSPGPFVLHTTGPPWTPFRGSWLPLTCNESRQDCPCAKVKGLGQAPVVFWLIPTIGMMVRVRVILVWLVTR